MATRKTNKSTKKVTKSTKTTRAARVSSTPKVTVERLEDRSETFEELATAKPTNPVNQRRLITMIAIAVGLGVLLFLAYRTLVLAWVDQTPVSRWSYYQQLDQKYGKELKDQLISEQLINNEAKKRNVSVDDGEINNEIKKIEDQQGGASQLAQILELQGMTMDELRKQVRFQVLIKKMFGQNINITDEQVNQYVEENKAQLGEVNDELKAQVKDQLQLQKVSQDFNAWLTEAKSGNRVVKY